MDQVCFALPVISGKTEEARAFFIVVPPADADGRPAGRLHGKSRLQPRLRSLRTFAGRVRRVVQAASRGGDRCRSEQPAAWTDERAAIELRRPRANRLDPETVTRPAFLTRRARVAALCALSQLPSARVCRRQRNAQSAAAATPAARALAIRCGRRGNRNPHSQGRLVYGRPPRYVRATPSSRRSS